MAPKIYVFGDFHIGNPQSHYHLAVAEIRRRRAEIDTLILAGDTLELKYGQLEEVFALFYAFRDELKVLELVKRTILIPGNHDAGIMYQFWQSGFILKPYAWLWCGDNYVLVVHGNGIGLERAIAANQRRRDRHALRLLKRQLRAEKPDILPPLSEDDWVVTAHFQIPVNDPHEQVAGMSDWTGDPRSALKRRYVVIDPKATLPERQVTIGQAALANSGQSKTNSASKR